MSVPTTAADVVERARENGTPVEAVGPWIYTRVDGALYYADRPKEES